MGVKFPFRYELKPLAIAEGIHWLTVDLENMGSERLSRLDVRLNSLDAYSVSPYGTGSYLDRLDPQEQRMFPFRVSAARSGRLYVTVDGWRDLESFHWESPSILVVVGEPVAELVSLFALTEPYPPPNRKIRCEAKIRGVSKSEGLVLEMWADTPSGDFEELAVVEIKELTAGEEVEYGAEITPQEQGLYTIYAYLYDGATRIGHQVEYVYVRES
jgi:hypothetical protein